MSFLNRKTILLGGVAALALGGAFGITQYGQSPAIAAQEVAQQAAPQAKPVEVAVIETRPVQIWKSFSARMEAVDYAEIRPQVSGTITEIRFEDGQRVEQGQVLYVIDPRPFEAAVKQAKAELTAAQTEAAFARKELKRAKGLIKTKAVSERLYDERSNAVNVSYSTIQAAEARLMQAEIDLDRAYVKAPISGRISRAEIKVGNLVSAGGNAPLLTSIVSNEGIYADFDVDENTYLTYIRPVAKNNKSEKTIPVKLSVDADRHHYDGFVHSFDNRINVASGTIRARAYFPNTDNDLLPGMFGNVQLGSAIQQDHILVSETAIGVNQDRKFVYVIDEQGIAQYREIQLGGSAEGKRIVLSGLKDGERIINGGLMRIRPGMPVVDKNQAPAAATS